jgi:hypothetical protein
MNTAIFFILALYFDYALPSSVHNKGPFFLFSSSFWGIRSIFPKSITLNKYNTDELEEDIKNEHNKVKNEKGASIRIIGNN